MKIAIAPFGGEMPAISARMLPNNNAVQAQDCDLSRQTLAPFKGVKRERQVSKMTGSIYSHPNGKWLAWEKPGISVVRSPLNDDVWQRLYWTGDGPPKMAPYEAVFSGSTEGPAASYQLGIPAPEQALVAISHSSDDDDAIDVEAVYTYSYVSEFGEEGPPAPPSHRITRRDGAPVLLSQIPSPPTGSHRITIKRIYRAETSGEYLRVIDLPASTESFEDKHDTDRLDTPLPSMDWDPPDPRMQGLTHAGNGILVGWFENTLCFCEPYRPHAWPVGYQLGFDGQIIGVAPTSGGLIVVTDNAPWLVTGASPAAMSQTKLDYPLGSVSQHSVVDMGEYAIYASDRGLVAIGGQQPQMLTEQLLTHEQWQTYNPKSIHAYRWHDRYLAFYTQRNGRQGAFLLDPQNGIQHFSTQAHAGYYDANTGAIYLLNNGIIYQWNAGSIQAYNWTSKTFTLPRVSTLSAGRIDASGYPVQINIIADGKTLATLEVSSDRMFRLPPGMHRTWQFRLIGYHEVFGLQVADSPANIM